MWNDVDGFYYDHVRGNNCSLPLKIRSMVGMVPLFTSMVLHESEMRRHPGFYKRTKWFLEHKKNLASRVCTDEREGVERERESERERRGRERERERERKDKTRLFYCQASCP